MRTPGIFIFGMVLGPCGWILELVCTVAPAWRTINNISGESIDLVLQQGLWDICKTYSSSQNILCGQVDTQYFSAQIITIARGLMLSSLILNLIGIGVASAGVRCWTEYPQWTVAGVGGVLIFISGVLTIIPVSWYTNIMTTIPAASTEVRVGYCLVLGFIGGILEVLGGLVMSIGLCQRCGRSKPADRTRINVVRSAHNPMPPPARRDTVPSVSSFSSASSAPYYSKHTETDFYRARKPDSRPVNAYQTRPYDSDL
ncbi:claudin-23 [Danio rerio]|uniref:Claudin 23b n=1 Tax=Danio rerio TaxID=7955 RepID=A0A0R4IHD8_DANRE|nr:claudin-23-like [Danio rerio]|eukprot:XP_005155637.1 claudin-23-like [Danio rerio]